jgi:SAM-dependent methyltransferase
MRIFNIIKNPKAYLLKLKELAHKLAIRYFQKGKHVKCQLCGWSGARFFKQNCPKCNSLPRSRLVPFAKHYFNLSTENCSVLHISPNLNEYIYFNTIVQDMGVYDRLDIRDDAFFINIVEDLTKTSLENESYHLVIAWHVLEHIPNDVTAISEVYRILKKGGRFLVSVPIYPANSTKTYEEESIPYKDFDNVHGHFDHCRSCGLDYFERFEVVGFRTETLKVQDLKQEDINSFGLRDDHVVWCFTK